MKSRRRILCLAALALVLAGAGFVAARLLHREAPDPQAPLPAFAFAQEAAPARILERAQEIAGGLYRLAETFSPDLVLAIDDSENLGLPYDESLGRALLEEANAQGCEPLAFVYIGQHWLLAQDADARGKGGGLGQSGAHGGQGLPLGGVILL